jgi:hypothetical protein
MDGGWTGRKAWRRARRARARAEGKCGVCVSRMPDDGRRTCRVCLDRSWSYQERTKAWERRTRATTSTERMRVLRERRALAGICVRCCSSLQGLGSRCECGSEKETWSRGCGSCGGGKIPKICEECR